MQKRNSDYVGGIMPERWRGLIRLIAWQFSGPPHCRENAVRAFCKVYRIPRNDVEARLDAYWLEAPETIQLSRQSKNQKLAGYLANRPAKLEHSRWR